MKRYKDVLMITLVTIIAAGTLMLIEPALASISEGQPEISGTQIESPHLSNYGNAHTFTTMPPAAGGDCEIYAVDLIGAWVDAGAELGEFPFESVNSETCTGDFDTDVLPLFTTADAWFEGSEACTDCHFDNSEDSRHEMDLSSYAGIMTGGDVLSKPPGVAIVLPGDWGESKLRERLRNNRMPPGWEFDIEETNRDGPLVERDGAEIYAVDLIAAWVDAGAPDGEFSWMDTAEDEHDGDFETDVLPLFTTADAWFEGSEACTDCHFDNSEDSRHEMDLSSYVGIMTGGDVLSEPPGVAIVIPQNWEDSKMKARLRNNRMPPGWEFEIEETNRDGPLVFAGVNDDISDSHAGGGLATAVIFGDCDIYAVDLIGAWVDAGADEAAFPFMSADGENCEANFETDVLPLFTAENAWFEGSEACTDCHFDNSEDSRHEMDLSSYVGIMTGGDVLSKPPGVAIVLPGDWGESKLRERLRNNRMPPGWEFDIEETNRDGPLVERDGAEIYAVDLIAAWVDAGAPDGAFPWMDTAEDEHDGDFETDVLPLFTTADAWFEGSEACTDCHFDNSEDSRHEMDLSSYVGIMTGGDVLSEPPGVAIVIPQNWEDSKMKARLRNNRMPPGWEFDIEETNRDGPMVQAGIELGDDTVEATSDAVETDTTETAVSPITPPELPPLPDPIITESVTQADYSILLLAIFGGITLVFGIGMAFVFGNQIGKTDNNISKTVYILALVFAIFAVITAGLVLHGLTSDAFTKTVTVEIDSPYAVEVAPIIPAVAEVRVEGWQAKIPDAYADLENPFVGDSEAAQMGEEVFESRDCYECHGDTLEGDGPFSAGLMPKPVNLTDPQLMGLPFMTDTYLYWRISEGGSHAPFLSAMPAWGNTISEDERWQLVTYIRSQTSDEAVDEGEQAAIAIIEQSGCFACHRLEHISRGGKIGPAWSELAVSAAARKDGMSAVDYVRESIVDPATFIVPEYEEASPMPTNFDELLSAEEIDILVEYLLNLPSE